MVSNEIILADEMVMLDSGLPEIVVQCGKDLPPTFSSLRTGRVVDHVLGHKFVDGRLVTFRETSK